MGDLSYATLYTPDVDRAATFYNTVLGWEVMAGSVPEGRQVTTTTLPIGLWGGQPEPTIRCCWLVDDVDAAVERVRAAGGTADVPSDEPYGRLVACVDNQGYAFDLHVPRPSTDPGPRTPLNGARPGDLSYLTLETPDHTTARAFYGSVLGWPAADDADPDVHPMLGVTDREVQVPRAVPMWKVADVAAAVERVRAAGGRADEPERKPYGISAYCTDDQGMAFYLGDA